MTKPAPDLLDLANGRPVSPGPGLVASAIEHRLGGLLLSAVEAGTVPMGERDHRTLVAADLAAAAHHRRLWRALDDAHRHLADLNVRAIALKGVAEEARWYDRIGERPCSDVDLVVSPDDVEQVVEVFRSALPSKPDHAELVGLVRSRKLQHLHFLWEGVPFDLHFDPLKLGLWINQMDLVMNTAATVSGPAGERVAVLAPELALVGFLTHLNKDRFSHLRAYLDVVRVIERTELDWDLIERFVHHESLEVPVWKSLGAVLEAVTPQQPHLHHSNGQGPAAAMTPPIPGVSGWRARLWDRLWPESSRLLGDQGMEEHRHRQLFIPALTGQWFDALRELQRVTFPPKALLDYHRPDLEDHGRLRRLSLDRLSLPGR